MGCTNRIGIYLYIDNVRFLKQALDSILTITIKDYEVMIVDPCSESNEQFYRSYVEKYDWKAIKVENITKAKAYQKMLLDSDAEYLNFTCASSVYASKSLNNIVKQIAYKNPIIGMHSKYIEIEDDMLSAKTKTISYDFNKALIYLPLFLNRYFIRYDIAKQYQFSDEYEDESLVIFTLQCLRHQSILKIEKDTLFYYNSPQERNAKTFVYQMKKWWYLDEMENLILPMLKNEKNISQHMLNLYMYLLQIRFHCNMNGRYTYALDKHDIAVFKSLAAVYLAEFDDQFIVDSCPNILLPRYMGLELLRIKYKEMMYADFRKDENGNLAAYVREAKYADFSEFVLSKSIQMDQDGNINKIGSLFFNYLLDPDKVSIIFESNRKECEIPIYKEPSIMKCFDQEVRKNFLIDLSEKKHIKLSLIIDQKKYPIKAKFARRKILSSIKKSIKESWLCPYIQKISKLDYIVYYNFYRMKNKMKKGSVLMLSDSRASLSGNLEFIDSELKKLGFPIEYFFKSSLKEKKSTKEKKFLCKQMASSEFIVIDDFYPIIYAITIRKKTKLIQVWHAMGAFKTVGFSRLGKPGGPNPRSISHRGYTATITSSESIRKNYAEAFQMDIEKVHATGIPRTDIFFDDKYKKEKINEIYEKYPVLKRKKVIMFAPTFRGNGQNSAHYNFEWLKFNELKEHLKDEYVFVIKLHPFIKNTEVIPEDDEFFINLTHEREINDLLFVTDVLITDYSSVIYEASLLDLKTIFYVPDLKEYTSSRDFYYPFEAYTYGDIATDTKELINSILHSANDIEKLNDFKTFFCGACDGKATQKTVEELFVKELS